MATGAHYPHPVQLGRAGKAVTACRSAPQAAPRRAAYVLATGSLRLGDGLQLVDLGGVGFEQGFWRQIQAQNWKKLEQHIAGNFVYVTPSGRLEREAAIEEIEKMRVSDYSIGDITTEMNGDIFVVTYTITLRGSSGFPPQPQRRMSVWQKQKAAWMIIAHSVIGTS